MTTSSPKPSMLIPRRTNLFQEFRALTIKAQKTLDLDDAIAAGNAWRAFLDDFLPPETKDRLEAIKFPNRAGTKV